jgi:hypothetical protein
VPLLRNILQEAGVAPELYSATRCAAALPVGQLRMVDLRTLMEHVGWKNAQSAMRYIDQEDP